MSGLPASPPCAGETLLLQDDGLGSTVADQRVRREEWSFPPYGQLPKQRAGGGLRFVGQWFDPAVQGYLMGNGHRVYRPAIMRFLSSDSLSPFGAGGVNAYAYCSGDPVNFHDPSGRGRTLLTKRLNKFNLPKEPLRDFLRPLIDIENFGKKRTVYKLKGEQFERYEFMGFGTKIKGEKLSRTRVFDSFLSDEVFYRRDDLFIPASKAPPSTVEGLLNAGFRKFKFDVDTLLEAISPKVGKTRAVGIADLSLNVQSNDYGNDLSVLMQRTRSTSSN
ncbi:RHS repeat-associated core domain-containing protein [Pseudomonas sp. CM27]|uniref:RHS repeat-associated core domain-containing protein n=1 Tax=Pseudomonas sp. CM27 TaxID=2738452 RepID=UPI001557F061|nr:RHS repeat-associated core domain-containing protein [Pseudomonas sp. CM27]NQD75715.1 RHS repeat-associated core domain-containing protein [Pseudomonas sp. CM27]